MADGTATQLQQGRSRIIERPRLTRLLDESPARIKMLVAPAGYGKTTLARQWLDQSNHLLAWCGFPRPVADAAVVATTLASLGSTLSHGRDTRVTGRLRRMQVPDAEVGALASILTRESADWSPDACVVIDDLQNLPTDSAAEQLLSSFLLQSKTKFLLCTRKRPTWIRARDILYGDVLEIGRHALSMTHEEAAAVLNQGDPAASGLVALADGWPAVVGLAALQSSFPRDSEVADLPETLYDFLAEELYQSLEPKVRDALCKLALARISSRTIAIELLDPDNGEAIVDSAIGAGWLSIDPNGNLELHPLLRAFLQQKLTNRVLPISQVDIEEVACFLIRHGEWDDAFALIDQHHLGGTLPNLLRAALPSILDAGRTASLASWVRFAEEEGTSTPEVALATAELLFRDGHFAEAEAIASAAAESFAPGDAWASWAYAAAGRSAHATNRENNALTYYRRARELAKEAGDDRRAALGELAAAIDLELPEAPHLLDALAPDPELIDQVVIHMGRWVSLHHRFGTLRSLDEPRRVSRLVHRVRDPMTRCSFRNVYGYILASAGLEDEGRSLLVVQFDDATRYGLDFVLPYAQYIDGLLDIFSGRFAEALVKSDELRMSGKASGDDLLIAYAAGLKLRCMISRGSFEEAAYFGARDSGVIPKSMKAELLTLRALALACAGLLDRALETALLAEGISHATEVRVGVAAARGVAAVTRQDINCYALAAHGLELARELFSVEMFLCACRAFPALPGALLDAPATREYTHDLLVSAGDVALVAAIGGRERATIGSWEALTPREQEVLQLVSSGMTNAQIAAHLVVAEGTVKAHVRHVLEKLEVKTRTAAALRVPHYARAQGE